MNAVMKYTPMQMKTMEVQQEGESTSLSLRVSDISRNAI